MTKSFKSCKFVKSWELERLITKDELNAMLRGCHVDLAYTRNFHKSYVLRMYLRRCPKDD